MMTMKQAKKLSNNFVDGAGDLAKRLSCTARDVADSIGPKRGLIGLAVIGVAIGGSVLATRLIRSRRAESLDSDLTGDVDVQATGSRKRKHRRNNVSHANAH
jgi:hypothetical protein